jgi:uncharacterized membrane protein YcaP (DUF421 family)
MNGFENFLELALNPNGKPEELTYAQVGLRALLVYSAVIAFVRFGKKRFLAQATAFDAILLVLIGSIASRGVSGTAPLFPSLFATAALILIHRSFSYLSYKSGAFSHLIKGNPTPIVKQGELDKRILGRAHMSDGDLREDLRKKGVTDLSEVSEATLERDGTLSVIKKS